MELVAVAERAFLAHGFADTTMQMVATHAAASKETLYRHFGSKEELFAEVVNNRADCLQRRLDADFERPNAIGEVLRHLGTNLLVMMTSAEVVALLRIVVAETQRDPALGQIFYALGPERIRARLTAYLTAAQERGEFLGRNPGLAASIFLGAVTAQTQTARLVLKDAPNMGAADIAERVDEVVAMFLQRYVRPGS